MAASSPNSLDLGSPYLAGLLTIASLTTLIILARAYTRLPAICAWKLEEYTTILALALGLPSTALLTVSILQGGLGKSMTTLSPAQILLALKFEFFAAIFNTWSGSLARVSAALYLNHALCAKKALRNSLWGLAGLEGLANAGAFLLALTQCLPDESVKVVGASKVDGICGDRGLPTVVFVVLGTLHVFTDAALATVLAFAIFRRRLSVLRRVLMQLILGMSIFSCICMIMFTIKREQDFKNPEEDITLDALPRLIWISLEQYLTIMIPSLFFLGSRLFDKNRREQFPTSQAELDAERGPIHELKEETSFPEIMTDQEIYEAPTSEIYEAPSNIVHEAPAEDFGVEICGKEG